MASFGFCCMATPRLGVQESSTLKVDVAPQSNASMEQKTSLHRCKLVPSCSSWSMSYVRSLLICSKCQCANATRVNLPKHWHCMFPSPSLLALPARSMLIYAHIFVDNLRDLIARRAAANCYLVRQLICQKIDGSLAEAV